MKSLEEEKFILLAKEVYRIMKPLITVNINNQPVIVEFGLRTTEQKIQRSIVVIKSKQGLDFKPVEKIECKLKGGVK